MGIEGFIETLNNYGLPGLFLVSFISNAIPGFPAIYLAFIGTYAAVTPNPSEAVSVIVISGIGAGLGKVLVFLSSRAVGKASIRLSKLREQTSWLAEEAEKGVFLLVFLFAALPLPDDLLFIPLGLTGFRAISFATAVITGKIVLTGLVYFLGKAYRSAFEAFVSPSSQGNLGLLVAGAIIGSIIATIIIFKMDWKLIYTTYRREGSLRATIVLVREFIRVITFNIINQKVETPTIVTISATTIIGIIIGWTWKNMAGAISLGALGFETGCLIISLTRRIKGEKRGKPNRIERR